jgi:iron complex outermembrane receptor protein
MAGAPVQAAVDLTGLSLDQLLEIRIVGASKYEQERNHVAAAVSVITRQEIRVMGWRTLAQALSSLPGVYTTYDRQYAYLGARGFAQPGDLTARMLVNINGNRVNDPIYDGGPAGREFPLDMDLVERIEFIPGPGGAVYGQNAMFGVVNVITRSGASLDGSEVALSYDSPQAGREARASWGRLLDNGVDVLLSVAGLKSRGEDRFFEYGASAVSGMARGLDGERGHSLFARLARGAWSFELVQGERSKDDPTASFFNDPLVPGQHFTDNTLVTQLRYQDSFAGNTLQASGRLFAGRYRYEGVFSYGGNPVIYPSAGDWRGMDGQLLSTAMPGHKLMIGVEAQDNTQVTQSALESAQPQNNLLLQSPGYRIGLYGQDEWQIGETLSATLGLRIDRNNLAPTQSSPRAALIWQATPATTLKALYGGAHRAPNAYERDYSDRFSQAANPSLQGETVNTLELVADHRIRYDLSVRGSVYQWKMLNLIVLGIEPGTGLTQYQSGPPITASGLELSADKSWASGERLRANLSLQHTRYSDGAALVNSPRLMGKLAFSAPLSAARLRVGYELQYSSQRRTLNGAELGGYAVSNLNLITQALARGLSLSLGVNNLFDKRYAHPGAETNWQDALEQDGRNVRVALQYQF